MYFIGKGRVGCLFRANAAHCTIRCLCEGRDSGYPNTSLFFIEKFFKDLYNSKAFSEV